MLGVATKEGVLMISFPYMTGPERKEMELAKLKAELALLGMAAKEGVEAARD